VSFGW